MVLIGVPLQTSRAQEAPVAPVAPVQPDQPKPLQLSAAQLFQFADAARDSGDFASAEAAYRALATNPDIELRTEARFRLALMLADRMGRPRDAAIELRRILDEKPDVARVRLELARMNALLGRLGAAEREFRAAQASGQLPPDVERAVRFYASALAAAKPIGGSIELALAPDSNINRATRADTLGTVIGDFTLSDDARAKSGLGLSARAQGYARLPLGTKTRLLARISGSGDFYRTGQFDDYALSLQLGPEFQWGADRITFSAGPSWRWFGQQPFSKGWGGTAVYQHPLGKRTQLRAETALSRLDNRRNDLQDSTIYAATLGLDRAFSARFGGGMQLRASRTAARDPGWSDWTGGASGYLFRELGRTTLVVDGSYARLTADERLFLYPKKRVDERLGIGLSATFRAIQWKGIAPFLRLRAERNRSTVGIFDFSRRAAELGVTSAF
ncbi:surface lipoprotein assembly modifier [Novosphingobium taihuense]|uniref:Surface lipoprotein assembly modifier C-terminal domain-containing protein n=1 Tax=Novosphingobium taihuense TaxID=260085 RepID=A0A7W7ADU9_9SPHN|nr:surface lipoprotein assembly modifier [Novosphingobium taihuense]MBB4615188.1 hypothetical protein [Novosphingobium taihuense]TWH84224.1 tetratricopeptide repeat protein [Novosphingobium taihuense]